MPSGENENDRIEELLPFFVNGTLDADEHDMVVKALEQDAELGQQVEILRLIRSQMQDSVPELLGNELGLVRLMHEIDAAPKPVAANSGKPPLFRLPNFSTGLVAASIALAFGAGTTFNTSDSVYVQASSSATLTVKFQAEVSQQQMSEMLLAQNLIIVDGPSTGGFYRLEMLDQGDFLAVVEVLRGKNAVFAFVDDPE